MRTVANVDQLYDNGMWMNVKSDEGCHVGVWTNKHRSIVILFKQENELYFMTFKNDACVKEFMENTFIREIVYDSRLDDIHR